MGREKLPSQTDRPRFLFAGDFSAHFSGGFTRAERIIRYTLHLMSSFQAWRLNFYIQ
jgi:hypothetical protein